MTTAKTPNPQSRFRLPDPPPREPDEMTAFDHVYKHGNNRYLAIHLGNQDTTLVVADRWIIAHPDADRSRARRPDLLIAFNVDPAAYHASNGYIVSEQGKPPDFILEVASESTGATDTGRQAPGLRRPRHLRILALRRNRTAPRRSPRRRPACRRSIPTYHHRATARRHPAGLQPLRSTYSCTGRTASYSGSTQRRSGPSSPTRTSSPAPNRPLPASASSRTKSAASGDNNPEHRIRLDSWRRWSTSDPKVAELCANSAISSGPGWREPVAPPRDWVTDASSLPIRFWFRRCGSLR